ncbi:MAG: gamma-butyrobetaine hydroxylase-like domain-containing protein [Terriglobia bacterium]
MTPSPVRIKLQGGNDTLRIEWSDGHQSAYSYKDLRDRCPCSTCTGKEGGKPAPREPSGSIPMFQAALRPERAELVGRYALQIYWSDGHSTGIYGFDYLRNLCPCAECEGLRTAIKEL